MALGEGGLLHFGGHFRRLHVEIPPSSPSALLFQQMHMEAYRVESIDYLHKRKEGEGGTVGLS